MKHRALVTVRDLNELQKLKACGSISETLWPSVTLDKELQLSKVSGQIAGTIYGMVISGRELQP